MAQQLVNIGAAPNDGTGDPARTGFDKINDNFTELYDRTVSVKDFGAVGDGVTDDWAAIRAALDSGAVRIYFPTLPEGKSYYSTKCFNLKKKYILYGDFGYSAATPNYSQITFANNACGFIVHRATTNADDYGLNNRIETATTGADGTIISGLLIKSGAFDAGVPVDGVTHGIRLRARAEIGNCLIRGFRGNGLHIVATSPSADNELEGNVNNFVLEKLIIVECWHGVFVQGNNVNTGYGYSIDATGNAGWGIWDNSFLANTWVACHTAGNLLGPYKSGSAPSLFIGCYSEQDQPPSFMVASTGVYGGLHGAGIYGNAVRSSSPVGQGTRELINETGVGETTVTAAGSGYTSGPAVTFGAPAGYSTATATATIGSLDFLSGKILRISITGGGAGYSAIPDVTVGGDGSGAIAAAVINGGVVKSITVIDSGSGYTSAPITIAAPTVTTATGAAYLTSTDGVSHIVVSNRGAGYTSAPGITLSGGGGSGATATCKLTSQGLAQSVVAINEANDDYTAVYLQRGDVNSVVGGWRLKMLPSSGDVLFDLANSVVPVYMTGNRTARAFGRSRVVRYVPLCPSGLWLGDYDNARQITYASAMPTSGEYARGDCVFNSAISELGSASSKYIILGWSRLVTGTAHVLNTDWLEARCLTGN